MATVEISFSTLNFCLLLLLKLIRDLKVILDTIYYSNKMYFSFNRIICYLYDLIKLCYVQFILKK
jgi:hypothetical protein